METGLNYNVHRDYDPATGRYLRSDPMELFGGQASTYAYVGGNPLSYIDPMGLCDDEVARCAKVKEDAIAECSDEELPTADKTDQAWVYQNCLRDYIAAHGCAPGGVPWPNERPNESPAIPAPNKNVVRAAEVVTVLVMIAVMAAQAFVG